MIAGIDLSTKAVDIVKLDEETDAASWHRFELTGQDAFDRARSVRTAMPGSSFWDDVLACGIEQAQMRGSGMASAYSLYRVQGAVLACLPRPLLVQPWNPSEWRKAVGLPGNAPKDVVAVFAKARLGIGPHEPFAHYSVEGFPWPQDAFDAYLIALATRLRLERKAAA